MLLLMFLVKIALLFIAGWAALMTFSSYIKCRKFSMKAYGILTLVLFMLILF